MLRTAFNLLRGAIKPFLIRKPNHTRVQSSGRWRTPFDPLVATTPRNNPGDYAEANAQLYPATPALHKVEGFRELVGGRNGLAHRLPGPFIRILLTGFPAMTTVGRCVRGMSLLL